MTIESLIIYWSKIISPESHSPREKVKFVYLALKTSNLLTLLLALDDIGRILTCYAVYLESYGQGYERYHYRKYKEIEDYSISGTLVISAVKDHPFYDECTERY